MLPCLSVAKGFPDVSHNTFFFTTASVTAPGSAQRPCLRCWYGSSALGQGSDHTAVARRQSALGQGHDDFQFSDNPFSFLFRLVLLLWTAILRWTFSWPRLADSLHSGQFVAGPVERDVGGPRRRLWDAALAYSASQPTHRAQCTAAIKGGGAINKTAARETAAVTRPLNKRLRTIHGCGLYIQVLETTSSHS